MDVINFAFFLFKYFFITSYVKNSGTFLISFLYLFENLFIVGSTPIKLKFLLKKDKKVPSLLPISIIISF